MTEYGTDWRVGGCHVRGSDGATNIPPYFTFGAITAVQRTGTGTYLITHAPIQRTELGVCGFVPVGTSQPSGIFPTRVSDTQTRVEVYSFNGTTVDRDFFFELRRIL